MSPSLPLSHGPRPSAPRGPPAGPLCPSRSLMSFTRPSYPSHAHPLGARWNPAPPPPAASYILPFFPFWAPGCPGQQSTACLDNGPPSCPVQLVIHFLWLLTVSSDPLSSPPPVLSVGAVVPGPPGDHAARRAPPVSPLLSMSVYLRPPHRCRRMIPAAWEGLQEHAQRCAPASPLLTVAPPSHLWVPRFVALPFCNPVAASPAPTAAPPVVWSIVYVCLPLTSQAELIPLRSLPSNPLPSSLLVPLAGSQECTNRFSFLFLFSCFFPPN